MDSAIPPCVVSFLADDATKLAIVHAVDKPIDSITVGHICEQCGISRGTFYNHFHSKYAMHPWFMGVVMEQTLDRVGRGLSWIEGARSFLQVADCARRFNRMAGAGPYPELMGRRRRTLMDTLGRHRGVRPTKGQRLLVEHYVESEARLCARWCAGGLPDDVAAVAELFVASVPGWLQQSLQPGLRAMPVAGVA